MTSENLQCLDGLIVKIGGANDAGRQTKGPCELLLEHLQAARRNLLGGMLGEARHNLDQAKESAVCIPDKEMRAETKKVLQSLIDPKPLRPYLVT
ncbi:MAG: hypothetical protein ABIR70_07630 [Bryobacteraceae bacterium]